MYNNNLIIDINEKIEIPQNKLTNFKIIKSIYFPNCIQIIIKPNETIDIFNLYLIVKSYACNLLYQPFNFFIVIKNLNEKEFIANNLNINEFKNISYFNFNNWFLNQLKEDWKYIKNECEYSIIFTYPIEIFDRKLIGFIKPIYPWKNNIMENLVSIINKEQEYIKIIENQKKKIIELEEEIKKIKS